MLVVSHFQARPWLAAWRAGQTAASASADLNQTTTTVALSAAGVVWPAGPTLTWETVAAIAEDANGCFEIDAAGGAHRIQAFSELTGRHYSLFPTAGAPTMLVAGFPMHRIKAVDPWTDTLAKVRAAAPAGRVLDTCTGLGYTALEAARAAQAVVTVELDPAAQAIARRNPWSQALFGHPKITQHIGDCSEVIETLADGAFNRIIHDPPTFSLGGELYSLAFYQQAFRVLTPNGRLFHYIGDPESKSGASVTKGVLRRLKAAGFARVAARPEAFGVVAFKERG